MPLIPAALLCLSLHHGATELADFRLSPQQDAHQPTNASPADTRAAPSAPADAAASTLSAQPAVKPHFRIATGYGHQIALHFAVRQIVPRGVSISFGPGVDTTMLVDWQGGREWNKVLASTVAPLGDRIDVGHNKVTISLKKS